MTILQIIFYGTVLSIHTITINPTGKPIILGYWADTEIDLHMHTWTHKPNKSKLSFVRLIILHVV